MTINRDRDLIEVQCDGRSNGEACANTSETYSGDDFYVMIEDIKSDGWHTRKTPKGEWTHYCPDCVEKGL